MTNLTDEEREAVEEYLYNAEIGFLVENLMELMPKDLLKELGVNLVSEQEDEEDETED